MAKEVNQEPKMEIIVQPNFKKIDDFIKNGVQGKNKIELETEKILRETGAVQKVDKYSLDRTKGYLKRIKDHIKAIELTRKTIKHPVQKMGEAIDSQAKKYKVELEEKAAAITREINNYKAAEEKRKQEEFNRIEGLAYKLRQQKTLEALQETMKSFSPADRKKVRVVEAFKYTEEKIEEEARLERMRQEQKELEEKREKQEKQEIDKLHLMTTLEELQHFEDYVENMYEEIPGKIQAAISEKRAKLNEEKNQREEKASQTDKKQAVGAPEIQNEVKIPKEEKKETGEAKKELSLLQKFEFLILNPNDLKSPGYAEDIRAALKNITK